MPCSASTGGGETDGGAMSALSAMLSVGVSRKLVLISTLRKRRMVISPEYESSSGRRWQAYRPEPPKARTPKKRAAQRQSRAALVLPENASVADRGARRRTIIIGAI